MQTNRAFRFMGVLLFAVSSLFLTGCGKDYVGTVNGEHVDRPDFYRTLEELYGRRVLEWMINKTLLFQENKRLKLVSEDELEAEYERFKAQFERGGQSQPFKGGEQFQTERHFSFKYWLRKNNRTEQGIKDYLLYDMILQKLRVHHVRVNEEALREFYEQHKDRFIRPMTVHLHVIETDSQERCKEARKQIMSGTSFKDAARRFNIRPNLRAKGGDVGLQPVTIMPSPMREVAASLPLNQVSEPISMNGRWLLIKVSQRQPDKKLSFKEARPMVEQYYRNFHALSEEQVFEKLYKKAKVTIHWDAYKPLEDKFRKQGIKWRSLPSSLFPPKTSSP